jgi:predicted AlkP superfamily pyrophosphatase or phosphodiesterase
MGMSESAVFRRLGVLAVVVLAVGVVLGATRQSTPPPTRPKLVVMLVVDQLRTDYIERYGHEWTGGLRRILDRGAWFSQGAFPYFNTVTCVGHATIGTGTFPSTHGMILNEWWVRAAGRREACTADGSTALIGHGLEATGAGESARKLRATTLAEEMYAQLDRSMRVMTFSLKARSAIGLAGHRGDVVVWWGGADFVTSSAFADGPIPAVQQFVEHHPVTADAGRTWNRTLPVDRYLFESPAVGAKPSSSMTPEFPHVLAAADSRAFSGQWQRSPFADAYLARMALHTARAIGAGSADRTDFLGISFSTLDYVGHNFGPRSHEVQDVLLQLDKTVGALLDGLDELVGAGNYVVALSSDHGVAHIPEYLTSVGIDAGRRSSSAVTEAVEEVLAALGSEKHVATTLYTDVYLTEGTWEKLRERPDLIRAVKVKVESLEGVSEVFTKDEIATMTFPPGSAGERMARGYYPGRSGDLLVAPRPYWIATSDGTTHGTGYAYDVRVPVAIMGRGVAPGEYLAPATPADLVPTLAYLLRVTLPQAQGRVLREALTNVR